MTLTAQCGLCSKKLVMVEKDVITSDDAAMYQQILTCDTAQDDGVTLDAQTDILVVVD